MPGTLLDAKIDDLWSQQIRHVYPYIPACAMPMAQAVGFQERLKKTGSIEKVRPTAGQSTDLASAQPGAAGSASSRIVLQGSVVGAEKVESWAGPDHVVFFCVFFFVFLFFLSYQPLLAPLHLFFLSNLQLCICVAGVRACVCACVRARVCFLLLFALPFPGPPFSSLPPTFPTNSVRHRSSPRQTLTPDGVFKRGDNPGG